MSAPDSKTDTFMIAADAYPTIDRARARTVRLVISIPALIMLIVLASGTAFFAYLQYLADGAKAIKEVSQFADYIEAGALKVLWGSIVFSLVASIAGFVLARQIVRPIKDLSANLEQLAAGDLTQRLSPITLGEFGQLGSSFNKMVTQLNNLFEERDRQLRESFNSAHMVLGRDGRVLQADQSIRRVFGIPAADLLGANLLDGSLECESLKDNPRTLDTLKRLVLDAVHGHPSNSQALLRDKAGALSGRFLFSCLPLEGSGDEALRVLVEIRDITGIANFYEQIQRADRLAAVGTLATGIAHEIRNPLASIRGMVQLMAELAPPGEEGQGDYHRRIIREVDRLEKLIAGIMNFAQGDDAPTEEMDINALLREVADAARHHVAMGEDAVQIVWELDANLPPAVLQAERLRQAFLNLVTNAFQHCAHNGLSPIRIQTMHLAVNPQRPIIVCIANPGEPFDEQTRERIFEPFYTSKPEGTGLGLPIAYQTVVSNGGLLEVECEDGEIQFFIRLPRELPSAAPRLDSRSSRTGTPLPLRVPGSSSAPREG